jgi:hypothetical protein
MPDSIGNNRQPTQLIVIETPLSDFGNAVTQGITELKQKRKFGLLLAELVIGDVAAMITGLFFSKLSAFRCTWAC